jgi:hypothetical protein
MDMVNIQQYIDNPKKLFNELYKVKINNNQEDNELKHLIIELNNNQNIDICEYAIKAINQKFNCFNVNNVLTNSIPYLNLNISSYCEYLNTIFQCFSNDSASFRQYESIQNLLKEQPNIAKQLLSGLIQRNEPFIAEHVSILLRHLYKNSYTKIIDFINQHNVYTTQGAILALGNLDYENSNSANKVLGIFKGIALNDLENTGEVITISVLKMKHFGEGFKLQILKLLNTNNSQIHFQVAQYLSLECKILSNEKWFENCLMGLNKTSCKYKDIINKLDHLLSELVKTNKPLFKKFFTSWIIHSDYPQVTNELQDLFDSTFHAICKDKKLLQELITDYFNHDTQLVNQAGAELILFCNRDKTSNIEFDKNILKALDADDILYICRKMLGYLIDAKTLCSLSYSVLATRVRNKQIVGIITDIFINHIGYNYLGTTLDFLNKKISNKIKSKSLYIALQNIIDKLNNNKKTYESLPVLNEIKPSKRQIYKEELANSKFINKAIEESQQDSVFNIIATTIHLKYGVSSCSYRDGNYSDFNHMSHFSHSMEIPKGQIVHPISLELDRFHFRLAKRGEK